MASGSDDSPATGESAIISVASERPSPLNFTHRGQPARLDLSRYQTAPAAVPEPGETVHVERPAPLNLLHNGEPATLDLSRYQGVPIQEPELSPPTDSPRARPELPSFTHMGQVVQFNLPTATEVRRTGLEMPTFTHNGQLATLDLSSFQAPERQHVNGVQERDAGVGERQGKASTVVSATTEAPTLLGRSGLSGLGEMLSRGGAQLSSSISRHAGPDQAQVEQASDTTRNSLSPR